MGITFVNAGAMASASATSVTPAFPTGLQIGDILIAISDSNDNNAVTPPAAWTKAFELNISTTMRLTCSWVRYTGTQLSQPFTKTGTVAFSTTIMAFRGCVPSGSPYGANSSLAKTTASTTATTTAITVAAKNSLLFLSDARLDSNAASYSAWTSAFGTMTEILDVASNTGNGTAVAAALISTATGGSSGTTQATVTSAATGSMLIELIAASDPPAAPTVAPTVSAGYNIVSVTTPASGQLPATATTWAIYIDGVLWASGLGSGNSYQVNQEWYKTTVVYTVAGRTADGVNGAAGPGSTPVTSLKPLQMGPSDQFDTIDTATWTTYGTVTANGQLNCLITNGVYSGIVSKNTYDFSNGMLYVQITPPAGAASRETTINIHNVANTYGALWAIQNLSRTVLARVKKASVNTDNTGVAYNSTSMAWVRISLTGSMIHFFTSSDGTNWSYFYEVVVTASDFSAVQIELSCGQGTEGTAPVGFFDNLNFVPVPTPVGVNLGLVWNVKSTVNKTVQAVWNVRTAVTTSLQAVWNVNQNVALPKLETLTDTFDTTVDTSVKWSGSIGVSWDSSGRAKIPCINSNPSLGTSTTAEYNISDSFFYAKITPPPNGNSRETSLIINRAASGGDQLYITRYVSGIYAQTLFKGVQDGASSTVPYDPVAHAWWRAREAAGVLYVDFSPDGLTWTNFWSKTPQIRFGNVYVKITSGFYGSETAADAYVDNVNTYVPPVTSVGVDLGLVWNTASTTSKSLQAVWNTNAVTSKSLQGVWNVRALVAKPVDLRWNVSTLVTKSVGAVWNVRTLTTKSLDQRWNVYALTTKSLDVRWIVYTATFTRVKLYWNVNTSVTKSLGLQWNVTAPTSGGGFKPTDVVGCNLWLDASKFTGLSDGAAVYLWPDKSGNGFDLYSREGQDNPTIYKTNVLNGLPVMRFGGAALPTFMFRIAPDVPIGTVGHIFVVTKYNLATFADYDGLFGEAAALVLLGEAGTNRLYPSNAGGPTYYLDGANSSGTRQGPMGVWSRVGISFGAPIANFMPTIGTDRFNWPRFWNGDIAEIVTYDHALSDTDRQAVDDYLYQKWFAAPPVGVSLDLRWNVNENVVAQPVGKSLAFVWNTQQATAKTLDLQWSLRSVVAKPLGLQWNVAQTTTKSLGLIWNLTQTTSKSLQTVWNLRQTTSKTVELDWAIRATVTNQVSLVWRILNQPVGKSVGFVWNLASTTGKSASLVWNIKATTAAVLILRWNTASFVTTSTQFIWRVYHPVPAGVSRQYLWKVAQLAGSEVSLRWNTRLATTYWSVIINGQIVYIPVVMVGDVWTPVTKSSDTYTPVSSSSGIWTPVNTGASSWT